MPWKVNPKNKARSLINSGAIDFTSDWGFEASDENKILGPNKDNWSRYASVHLAVNPDAEPNTKGKYAYPFAKLKGGTLTIYRSGVIAAKGAAAGARGATKNTALYNLASSLLDSINAKMEKDKSDIMKCPECKSEIESNSKKCPECGAVLDACSTKKKKKKMDSDLETVQRYDFYEPSDEYMEERFTKTDEGYLKGRARVTNIGVFTYLNSDGSIHRELRLPEEVFHPDSIKTIELLPISDEHPPEQVITIDNIKEHQIGSTGNGVHFDNYHLSIPIVITDPGAIDKIKIEGKQGISAGYKVDIEEKSGVWLGMPYDAIQRNIRYNHIALVQQGRAGDAARLKLDSAENIAYRLVGDSKTNFIKEDDMPNFKTCQVDGVDYQAEAEVIKALNTEKKKADKLQEDFSRIEAERDNLKAKTDQLEKELQESKLDDGKIQAAVDRKLSLLTKSYQLGVDVKSDASDESIMKEIILKAFPDAKLDGKDPVYIEGRFDGAVDILVRQKENEVKKPFTDISSNGDKDNQVNVDSEIARKSMIKRMQDNYKIPATVN